MLEELAQAITRLESCSLSSSEPLSVLKKQHERFSGILKRISGCHAYPKVMRILTEEALEEAEWILRLPQWERYVSAVKTGLILDTEYRRYIKAKDFVDRLLQHSYVHECKNREYKAMRYEYALSSGAIPAWFQTEKAALWVEEIVTAYCFIAFSVLDFAEEQQAA